MEYNKSVYEEISRNIYDLAKEKRYEEVEKILETVLHIEKNNSELINLIGMIKYRQCKFFLAKELFKYSYNLDKNKTALYFLTKYSKEEAEYIKFENIVYACKVKEYKNAIQDLEGNTFLMDEFLVPNVILILLYYNEGKLGKALSLIRKVNLNHGDTIDSYNLNIMETIKNKCLMRYLIYGMTIIGTGLLIYLSLANMLQYFVKLNNQEWICVNQIKTTPACNNFNEKLLQAGVVILKGK